MLRLKMVLILSLSKDEDHARAFNVDCLGPTGNWPVSEHKSLVRALWTGIWRFRPDDARP